MLKKQQIQSARSKSRQSLSKAQALALLMFFTTLFLLATDGAILGLSSFPRLYGIIDAPSARFEETLLYLPVIRNFSFFDILRADFTGPGVIHGLAPFPYATFMLAKLLSLIAGGSPNGSMFALHTAILLTLAATYLFCLLYSHSGDIAFLFSLLAIFGLSMALFSAGLLTNYPIPKFWLATAVALALFGMACWLVGKSAHWLAWLTLVLLVLFTTTLARVAWPHLLGIPLMGEQFATRFLSPTIPIGFLTMTMYVLIRCDQALATRRFTAYWLVAAALSFVTNFYVYFVNWLILALPFCGWILFRRRALLQNWRACSVAACLAAVVGIPFLLTLVGSKTDPATRDLVTRSGQFGIKLYHRFNYPPPYAFVANLAIAAAFAALLYTSWRAKRHELTYKNVLPFAVYLASIVLAYGNYVAHDTIPQALLLHRYWVPLIVLTALSVYPLLGDESNVVLRIILGQRGTFVIIGGLLLFLGIFAAGTWNIHTMISGPAFEPLAKAAEGINDLATPEDIVVTDWQALNLLLPTFKMRTLSPDPIITLATNDDLVASYKMLNKLQNKSPDDFFRFLGDLDVYGEVHEMTPGTPRTAGLLTQTRGLAYPMPPPWLEANRQRLMAEYAALDLATEVHRYPSLLICLKDGFLPAALQASATALQAVENLRCWRIKS